MACGVGGNFPLLLMLMLRIMLLACHHVQSNYHNLPA